MRAPYPQSIDPLPAVLDALRGTPYESELPALEAALRGDELLRVGMPVEVERATADLQAPNGQVYHVKIKASTGLLARDGGVIPMKAWRGNLKNFKANPVIQFAHDYWEPPIAKAVDIRIDKDLDALLEWWLFHDESELSRLVHVLYERGFMRAASVGFIIKAWRRPEDEEEQKELQEELGTKEQILWIAEDVELLETSAVPVPADPYALVVKHAVTAATNAGFDVSRFPEALETAWRGEPAALAAEVEEAEVHVTPTEEDEVNEEQLTALLDERIAPLIERLDGLDEAVQTLLDRTEPAVEPEPEGEGDGDDGDSKTLTLQVPLDEGETHEEAIVRHLGPMFDNALQAAMGAPTE